MKSILIATAENNALYPLTRAFPSPMIPLVDRPVMVYTIELLARHGIKDISAIVLFSWLKQVESYFNDGKRWNVNISYTQQHQQLGDAGSLKQSGVDFNETFLVLPADSFFDFDITEAFAHHRRTCAQLTMLVSHRSGTGPPEQNRPVQIDSAGCIVDVGENANTNSLQATGAFLCEPQILQQIPMVQSYDVYGQLMPALLAQNTKLSSFEIDGYWNRLDSFAAYQDTQEACLAALIGQDDGSNGKIRKLYATGQRKQKGLWRAPNSIIHPTVQITGPAFIGEGCQIGADVEIGPNVVIGSHVVVDEGATIRNSTVLQNTYVGQLVELDNRIVNKSQLIDAHTGEYAELTDDFLLSEASPAIISERLKNLMGRMIGFFLLLLCAPLIFASKLSAV